MARVTEIHGEMERINGMSFYLRHGKLYVKRKSSLSKDTTMSDASLLNIQQSVSSLGYTSGYIKRLRGLMNGFVNVLALHIRVKELQRRCHALVNAHITNKGLDAALVLHAYGGYLDGLVLGTMGFHASSLRPTLITDAEGGSALVWALDTLTSPLVLPYYVHATYYRLVLFGFVMPEHCPFADNTAYGEVLGHVFTDYIAVDAPQNATLDALRLYIKQPLKATDSVVAIVGLCYYSEMCDGIDSQLNDMRAFSLLVLPSFV